LIIFIVSMGKGLQRRGSNRCSRNAMYKYLVSLLLCTRCLSATAQDAPVKSPWDYGLSIGYIYQENNYLTVGAIVGKNVGNLHKRGMSFGLAGEFGLRKETPVSGVKVFYDVRLFVFALRLNGITYFKGSINDFRFTPEIGLTSNGLYNIYYGYNIPVGGTEFSEVSRSRLSITFNLFRGVKITGEPRN
jgi:hypothetical protein